MRVKYRKLFCNTSLNTSVPGLDGVVSEEFFDPVVGLLGFFWGKEG